MLLYHHSGFDPWFDRLTTLSKVEGESSTVYRYYISGCWIAKSGQTAAHQIRPAFIAFIEEFGKDGTDFQLVTTAFEGPIGYITWTAETSANTYDTSTDTFYVVDGKIRTQTLTMDIIPK